VDKNISIAFEPWSIFKAFTMAIWLDSDEVRLDDYYQDDWEVQIDIYRIQDADKGACMWYHSLLEALINSCNVWMIRIVQSLGKEIFYNYLTNFWFWNKTWIELAEEKNWSIPNAANVSMAKFFNNSFWQWVTVTQIQLATAYSVLVNWWKYIPPTIVSQIRKKSANNDNLTIEEKVPHSTKQILRHEVSDEMRNALFNVVNVNNQYKSARVEWYRLGAKSWTSQIAYKWRYQRWEWWTQATFAGIVSIDDPEYIVLIWVSRPRTSQWWVWTAWKIFGEIATFLIWYSMME
jgi:cell division protein FtsI/penicillin-binding protein 2